MALSSHDSLPKLQLWKPRHDHQGKAEVVSEPNRMSAELSQEDPDDPTLELLRIMTPYAVLKVLTCKEQEEGEVFLYLVSQVFEGFYPEKEMLLLQSLLIPKLSRRYFLQFAPPPLPPRSNHHCDLELDLFQASSRTNSPQNQEEAWSVEDNEGHKLIDVKFQSIVFNIGLQETFKCEKCVPVAYRNFVEHLADHMLAR
uniref:Uncharacterized protein n=1 Tax=Salix viminalis TaxID=40686 RepID=A0A6N2LTH6_SALVM